MATRLPTSRLLLPGTAPRVAAPAAGGCVRCAVRHYCAVYSPLSAGPPADCPFGPGPAATRR